MLGPGLKLCNLARSWEGLGQKRTPTPFIATWSQPPPPRTFSAQWKEAGLGEPSTPCSRRQGEGGALSSPGPRQAPSLPPLPAGAPGHLCAAHPSWGQSEAGGCFGPPTLSPPTGHMPRVPGGWTQVVGGGSSGVARVLSAQGSAAHAPPCYKHHGSHTFSNTTMGLSCHSPPPAHLRAQVGVGS